ncbi:MAG: glycosyl hydrolase [Phycisphaerae bacterium]
MRTVSLALLTVVFSGGAGSSLPANQEGPPEGESGKEKLMSAETFAGLKLRSIGPALMSGRIGDFAVNPKNRSHYFVAVCSGGVWKTANAGTTWTPVFDGQGSYSIGCVTMDPGNPNVVWVGTGENNSQRSVGFGDGVYRTRDGGKHWENMGLKESEHIGMIVIDPRDSDTVYVAAQGPLWRAGGERGLYKSADGGKTWNRILHISDDTGVNEVHMDPRDPDVLYASSYQRRRRVWTLIDGGPESAIHKSTDAGATWRKITHGIPKVDKGRIGLCVSPANPDVVYAIIEAADDEGGFFRSTDRGETWEKRNKYMTTSPQYYNEIVCDPIEVDRVYTLDTFMHVTEDGGKDFKRMPRQHRHVDDHALWIDPENNDYLLVGCDGGVYESFDRGENWSYKANLPVTQFYRVSVDNSTPFYYVYGGTQDNSTEGGPSRTKSPAGITNEDWFITVGGDGYETQVDPEDPNIVYSLWQYGGLVRHDRRSGEVVDIKPREAPGEEEYRWNWDTPLIISPHNHKRLYVAANRLFRSDDRGNSWTVISGELSRGLDRNALEVMGKIQSVDAVSKHLNTSLYGNAVALIESPLVEGLIYVGTDDGLIHVTEDGGKNWRRIALFPGVPDMTYVSRLEASQHAPDTVFAAFDNHKNGDFKPYILKSTDRGETWVSIAGDLPERDTVYASAEDHENPELLFAGTEFGAYFTVDGGAHWIRLKGGVPTIAVRDLAIQKRESDLVLGTFGRGFYILDDYTPLRLVSKEYLEGGPSLFPVKPALRYIETSRLGGSSGKGSQGASFYAAPNPPYGAVFTYYLKEKVTTRKEQRKEAEKKAEKAGTPVKYPTIEELRAEDEEKEPSVVLIVRDDSGEIVRRITGPREKGIHRVAWDLRYPASTPTVLKPPTDLPPWVRPPAGPLALPGTYTVTLTSEVDGEITEMTGPESFDVIPLELATFAAKDRAEVMAFHKKVARLQRAVRGTLKAADEAQTRIAHIRKAFLDTPAADRALLGEIHSLGQRLNAILTKLRGDRTVGKRQDTMPPSINERVQVAMQWYVTSPPTQTQRDAYEHAATEFAELLADLRGLMEEDLTRLEEKLEAAGAPWTPGRIPGWEKE